MIELYNLMIENIVFLFFYIILYFIINLMIFINFFFLLLILNSISFCFAWEMGLYNLEWVAQRKKREEIAVGGHVRKRRFLEFRMEKGRYRVADRGTPPSSPPSLPHGWEHPRWSLPPVLRKPPWLLRCSRPLQRWFPIRGVLLPRRDRLPLAIRRLPRRQPWSRRSQEV